MKKILVSLLAIMAITIVSVNLSSCSKDEETVDPTPTIVGTWKYSWDSGYNLLTFYENGTCRDQEYDHGKWERDRSGNYEYNAKEGYVILFSKKYDVIRLTTTELVLLNWLDSGNITLYRQNTGPIDPVTDYSKYLPGQWEYNSEMSDGTPIWVSFHFDKNGAGTIAFYDEVDQDWGTTAYGTYTIKDNTITANYSNVTVEDENYNHTTYHGFTHGKAKKVTYTILSCDAKTLNMKDDSGRTFNLGKI